MLIEWWTWVDSADGAPTPSAVRVDVRRPAATSLAERRATAMRGLFPLLSAWRAPAGYVDQVSAAYRDLAAANDPIDLEVRRRRIERTLRAAGMPAANTQLSLD